MRRILITGRNSSVPHHPFTSSGMLPVARAAGDLPRFTGPKAHTPVQRRVPGQLASHRPAVERPPQPLGIFEIVIDAVTVIMGLAVFGMVAFFLMLLS